MRQDALDAPNPLDTPRVLADLDRSEHLLVWALRAIGVGRGDCPLLAQTFHRALGPKGPEALGAYFVLVKSIALSSRRRLAVHVPGCACLGADELAILGIVAAAQSEADADADAPGLLGLRLRFLVAGEPNPVLARAARIVARALQLEGHALPRRAEAPPCREHPPDLHVIH